MEELTSCWPIEVESAGSKRGLGYGSVVSP
jgi:hypothetical protein